MQQSLVLRSWRSFPPGPGLTVAAFSRRPVQIHSPARCPLHSLLSCCPDSSTETTRGLRSCSGQVVDRQFSCTVCLNAECSVSVGYSSCFQLGPVTPSLTGYTAHTYTVTTAFIQCLMALLTLYSVCKRDYCCVSLCVDVVWLFTVCWTVSSCQY